MTAWTVRNVDRECRVAFLEHRVLTWDDDNETWHSPFHLLDHHAWRAIVKWGGCHGPKPRQPSRRTSLECLRVLKQFEARAAGPTPATDLAATQAFEQLKQEGKIR